MKRFMIISLLAVVALSSCKGYKTVPVEEFEAMIANGDVQILDVRTPEEYYAGHIPGALNVDVRHVMFDEEADVTLGGTSKPVAVYCRSGKRHHK